MKSFPDSVLGIADLGGALRHAAGRVTGAAHATARGQYLVTVTAIIGQVRDLASGAYEYDGAVHRLTRRTAGDHRERLARATVDAAWAAHCPMLVLLSTHAEHADGYFAELGPGQGERFAWLEAGLIAQNLYLWASATGMAPCSSAGWLPPRWRMRPHRCCPPATPPWASCRWVTRPSEPTAPGGPILAERGRISPPRPPGCPVRSASTDRN
ncbi:nitroreductase family protein [Sanguibacter sp. Z1732]|uniref:nitroreductase family protein n=1 Tax=Sanguibacter sp. Z1732 TaxID=3435412 RepID=UPI003D9C9100